MIDYNNISIFTIKNLLLLVNSYHNTTVYIYLIFIAQFYSNYIKLFNESQRNINLNIKT